MALSKSRRMQILLAINGIFFLIELTVGIAVHSLALVADSFHMLNDVLSLCVGIWAVNVAKSKSQSKVYTYGWQRAETLGALVNGVFLVALCFSIILEAVQRFFDLPEISNPVWILAVGCAGLAMNILGLFLFHDHSHSHDHPHPSTKRRRSNHHRESEEGHVQHRFMNSDTIADEDGNIEDVLPENRVRASIEPALTTVDSPLQRISFQDSQSPARAPSNSPSAYRNVGKRRRSRQYSTLSDIAVHPASIRKGIIAASRIEATGSESASDSGDDRQGPPEVAVEEGPPRETTPLLHSASTSSTLARKIRPRDTHAPSQPRGSNAKSGHKHSHDDLNMRGVFLHVLGDALGNIGVIATALFIWLTPYSWRFYSDPVISLVITLIILGSAIPLCRAASRILLQAVPFGLNVDDIKADILSLRGIVGCHHLHVWQLSDTKLVASLHVRVGFEFKGEGSEEYMELARQIRRCLHGYGIHSSTIQPEFLCEDVAQKRGIAMPESRTEYESCSQEDTSSDIAGKPSFGGSAACLLDCGDDCGEGAACCELNRPSNDRST